jgi:hypothetical protein
MTHPALDRAVLSNRLAQIAQLMRSFDSKTDQTAQSDQRIEKVRKFRVPPGQELTSPHPKLTSGTAQRADCIARGATNPSSRALQDPAGRVPQS